MSTWWNNLVENLAELPAATWAVLALMVVLGAALVVLYVKKAPKVALIAVGALLLVALVVACFVTIPSISADLESGGTEAGSWVYAPAFWSVILCLVGVVVLVYLLRQTQWTVKMLASGSLCIALSFILDCITLYRLPQGGGINPAAMLPVMFFAWTYGVIPGLTAGIVHSLLGMIAGAYVIHPLQFLLDYIFPFAALGLAGLFRKENAFPIGIVVACFVRFLMHFLSGWVYFGEYAPENQGPVLYSILYNGSYMLPNTIICLVVYLIPPVKRALNKLRYQWNPELKV